MFVVSVGKTRYIVMRGWADIIGMPFINATLVEHVVAYSNRA